MKPSSFILLLIVLVISTRCSSSDELEEVSRQYMIESPVFYYPLHVDQDETKYTIQLSDYYFEVPVDTICSSSPLTTPYCD
jgi:hypothetical protein